MTNELTLTVCIITYNHAEYIERAVNSALAQLTDFDYKIVVADDCSTDGTTEILLGLKARHPERISLLLHNRNIGPAINWLELLQYPKSKYIAYLEGDDFWIDEQKLQKQVDALEVNQGYSLCFHNVLLNNIKKNETSIFPNKIKTTFNTFDVIVRPWFCPTGSIVFKSEIVKLIPRGFENVKNGDVLLLFLASTQGPLLRLDETMGVYNYMSSGSMSSRLDDEFGALNKLRNISSTLLFIDQISNRKYWFFVLLKQLRVNLLIIRFYIKLIVLRIFKVSLIKF